MRKYELTDETKIYSGITLHRIKSLVDFGCINAGEIGGWIETEDNLSQYGNAWVGGNAIVRDSAHVGGNAIVRDSAHVGGNAIVRDSALVGDDAHVGGNAIVRDSVHVGGNAHVLGNALVYGKKCVFWISGIGSRNGTTTFFNCADGKIRVSCGCFYGDLDEFAKAVNKTHGDNEYGQVYRIAIEMAKKRIHTVCEDVKND